MPLQLKDSEPEPLTVKIAGASLKVRPATAFEFDLAVARTANLLAGLINSADAAKSAADALGSSFASVDFMDPAWASAASRRLNLIDLATTCVTEWSGIVDDAGKPIEMPNKGALSLLLRSAPAAKLIENAIFSEVNREFEEKNGSAASPNGAAAAADNTAAPAETSAPNAPEGL
jgi:hypothetical protein